MVNVETHDPLFAEQAKDKILRQMIATCIDNGSDDELIITVRYGAIYAWSAELWVGPRIIQLQPTPDLLYSGIRLKLGNAFTKENEKNMKVVITKGILK